MANIERRDKIVNSIARIQSWAKKDGPNATEEEVQEQVKKVKSRWLSFQAESQDVKNTCGPLEIGFHTDVEKNAEFVYMETLQLLIDLLRAHSARVWSDACEDAGNGTTTTIQTPSMIIPQQQI